MHRDEYLLRQSSTVTVVATRPATFSPRNGGEAARCAARGPSFTVRRPPSGHYGLGEIASSVRNSPQYYSSGTPLGLSQAPEPEPWWVRTRRVLRVEGPRA